MAFQAGDMVSLDQVLQDRRVAVVKAKMQYCFTPPFDPSDQFPEYDGQVGREDNPGYWAVREAFRVLGYDEANFGTSLWNPLENLIKPGETVVVKPNWVCHKNLGERAYGLTDVDSLITNGSILRAVLDYVCIALKGSGKVVIGDSPIQNADWEMLIRIAGASEIIDSLHFRFPEIRFELKDFRLECAIVRGNRIVEKSKRSIDTEDYIEVDLKGESMLVPLMLDREYSFGVANYPKHKMTYAHSRDRNVYLFPREILEADVFLNLSKVKTHMKGGITCALKNLFGVIGMKDYLPHFRFGSPKQNGDEYPDGNWLWDIRWWFVHEEWGRDSGFVKFLLWHVGRVCGLGLRVFYKYPRNYWSLAGGGWFGNDTLWRTILDVNRAFFYYDRTTGAIQLNPSKSIRYLVIADGLVGGHEESPLCPTPKKLGLILVATNPVALDAVTAALIGFDIYNILQIYKAFSIDKYPLVAFQPEEIEILGLKDVKRINDVYKKRIFVPFEPSSGWKGHIEYSRG